MEGRKITIIGTGNFGIALGKRLLAFGFEVLYGSRRPNKSYLKECFGQAAHEQFYDVTSIGDAWLKSDGVVIVATSSQPDVYADLVDAVVSSVKRSGDSRRSRVVVDVSNRWEGEDVRAVRTSNAQMLGDMFEAKLAEAGVAGYQVGDNGER